MGRQSTYVYKLTGIILFPHSYFWEIIVLSVIFRSLFLSQYFLCKWQYPNGVCWDKTACTFLLHTTCCCKKLHPSYLKKTPKVPSNENERICFHSSTKLLRSSYVPSVCTVFENQFAFPCVQILQWRGLCLCYLIQYKAFKSKDSHLLSYCSQWSRPFLIPCMLELWRPCYQLVSGIKREH